MGCSVSAPAAHRYAASDFHFECCDAQGTGAAAADAPPVTACVAVSPVSEAAAAPTPTAPPFSPEAVAVAAAAAAAPKMTETAPACSPEAVAIAAVGAAPTPPETAPASGTVVVAAPTRVPEHLFRFEDVSSRDMHVHGRDRLAVTLDGSRVLVAQSVSILENTGWVSVATLSVYRGSDLVHKRNVRGGYSAGVAVCPVTGRVFWAVRSFGIGIASLGPERTGLDSYSLSVPRKQKGFSRLDDPAVGLDTCILRALCCRAGVVAVAYQRDTSGAARYHDIAFLCTTTGARTHEIRYVDHVGDMAFVADEDALVVANAGATIGVVSVSSGAVLQRLFLSHSLSSWITCTSAGELVVSSLTASASSIKVFSRNGTVYGPSRAVDCSCVGGGGALYRMVATHGDAIYALCAQEHQYQSCVVFR